MMQFTLKDLKEIIDCMIDNNLDKDESYLYVAEFLAEKIKASFDQENAQK